MRKEIVSYFFKVIFYGKVWKWINIVKYKEKGQRKQKWVGVVRALALENANVKSKVNLEF